jgi:hypothetical protein
VGIDCSRHEWRMKSLDGKGNSSWCGVLDGHEGELVSEWRVMKYCIGSAEVILFRLIQYAGFVLVPVYFKRLVFSFFTPVM